MLLGKFEGHLLARDRHGKKRIVTASAYKLASGEEEDEEEEWPHRIRGAAQIALKWLDDLQWKYSKRRDSVAAHSMEQCQLAKNHITTVMGMRFAETDLREQRLVGEARRSEGIGGVRNLRQKEGNSEHHHSVFTSDFVTDGKHRKIYWWTAYAHWLCHLNYKGRLEDRGRTIMGRSADAKQVMMVRGYSLTVCKDFWFPKWRMPVVEAAYRAVKAIATFLLEHSMSDEMDRLQRLVLREIWMSMIRGRHNVNGVLPTEILQMAIEFRRRAKEATRSGEAFPYVTMDKQKTDCIDFLWHWVDEVIAEFEHNWDGDLHIRSQYDDDDDDDDDDEEEDDFQPRGYLGQDQHTWWVGFKRRNADTLRGLRESESGVTYARPPVERPKNVGGKLTGFWGAQNTLDAWRHVARGYPRTTAPQENGLNLHPSAALTDFMDELHVEMPHVENPSGLRDFIGSQEMFSVKVILKLRKSLWDAIPQHRREHAPKDAQIAMHICDVDSALYEGLQRSGRVLHREEEQRDGQKARGSVLVTTHGGRHHEPLIEKLWTNFAEIYETVPQQHIPHESMSMRDNIPHLRDQGITLLWQYITDNDAGTPEQRFAAGAAILVLAHTHSRRPGRYTIAGRTAPDKTRMFKILSPLDVDSHRYIRAYASLCLDHSDELFKRTFPVFRIQAYELWSNEAAANGGDRDTLMEGEFSMQLVEDAVIKSSHLSIKDAIMDLTPSLGKWKLYMLVCFASRYPSNTAKYILRCMQQAAFLPAFLIKWLKRPSILDLRRISVMEGWSTALPLHEEGKHILLRDLTDFAGNACTSVGDAVASHRFVFAATDERQMKLVTVQACQHGTMRYCTGVTELVAKQLATLRSLPSTYITQEETRAMKTRLAEWKEDAETEEQFLRDAAVKLQRVRENAVNSLGADHVVLTRQWMHQTKHAVETKVRLFNQTYCVPKRRGQNVVIHAKDLYIGFGLLATSLLLRERAQFRFERIRGMCPLLSIAVIDDDSEVRGYMFPTTEPGKSLKVKDLLGGSFVRIDQPHLVMLLEFLLPLARRINRRGAIINMERQKYGLWETAWRYLHLLHGKRQHQRMYKVETANFTAPILSDLPYVADSHISRLPSLLRKHCAARYLATHMSDCKNSEDIKGMLHDLAGMMESSPYSITTSYVNFILMTKPRGAEGCSFLEDSQRPLPCMPEERDMKEGMMKYISNTFPKMEEKGLSPYEVKERKKVLKILNESFPDLKEALRDLVGKH
eukprot:g1330.t1